MAMLLHNNHLAILHHLNHLVNLHHNNQRIPREQLSIVCVSLA